MTIHEIKIKVDVPYGWDVVDFRAPQRGEMIITAFGNVEECKKDLPFQRFVLRSAWQPPAWLRATECKCVWRFHGKWYASIERPVKGDLHWEVNFPNILLHGHILTPFTEPCGPEVHELETLKTWE